MEVTADKEWLNQHSLASFRNLFNDLFPPQLTDLQGLYQGEFVGPYWLRRIAGPALYLGGLPGWWGKSFDGEGNGTNILLKNGQLVPAVPVALEPRESLIDGRTAICVTYPRESPFPLPLVVDELRTLEGRVLLGMTIMTRLGLSRFSFPFVLRPSDRTL